MSDLRDFFQGASNSIASNVSAPVDGIAWLLRKAGVPVPPNPMGGSDWMAEKGLTQQPQNRTAGLLGEFAGMTAPMVAAAKAPQIAKGLLSLDDKAMEMGRVAIENRMVNSGMIQPATVWHGSPHKFNKFDSSKIGTGEGAQAYGHGLYLAESPTVAQSYIPTNEAGKSALANQLAAETKKAARYSNEGAQEVFEMFNKGYTPQAIRNNIDNIIGDGGVHPSYAKKMNQAYDKGMNIYQQNQGGSLYKVDLPDDQIAKMLDWDKPLSQQPPDVQAVLMKHPDVLEQIQKSEAQRLLLNERSPLRLEKIPSASIPYDASRMAGKDALTAIRQRSGLGVTGGVEQQLRAAGIPGIRYLDGGSRGTGAGTSNYVVFPGNEDILKILERNGKGLLE